MEKCVTRWVRSCSLGKEVKATRADLGLGPCSPQREEQAERPRDGAGGVPKESRSLWPARPWRGQREDRARYRGQIVQTTGKGGFSFWE